MYKILVIDDEKSIVKGLVETLNREEELEVQVYAASTVSEGLAIAREVKLDILCTDINMPVMDGFMMAKSVLEYWKECKIVFLTGYDTFDYIYKAINEFGGKYILKNEEHKFLETIGKCVKEIKQDQENQEAKIQCVELMDEKKKNQKQKIWGEFIRSGQPELPMKNLVAWYTQEEEGIRLEEPFYIAVGRIVESSNVHRAEQDIAQVYLRMKEQYQYFYRIEELRFYNGMYLFIAQKKGKVTPSIEEVLTEIQTILLEGKEQMISFLYSEKNVEFQSLKEQIKLYEAILSIKLLKNSPVLVNLDEMLEKNRSENSCQEQYEIQVDKMIMERQFVELGDIFSGLYLSVKNTYEISLADTQMYYKCIGKIASYIERNISYQDMPEDLQRSYYHLRYMSGIDEIHNFVIQFLRYMDMQEGKREGAEDAMVVQKVENYVLNHITEEVTLSTLARLVYFNPSYLSRFYKAATGRNLSNFIKDAKVMKAKELLEKSDKKICDISKLLGFESDGYFTVFFKKQVGMTPTEYRNNQS